MKFGSLKFKPAQQGSLDGLCGVYSVMNFCFRRYGWSYDDPRRLKLFESFLSHLHEREKFTVRRVARTGFRRGQLQAAFGKLARSKKMNVKAVSLSTFARQHGAADIFDVICRLEKDEAAMIHYNVPGHWVLAHSYKGDNFIVDDSSDESQSLTFDRDQAAQRQVKVKEGLVFLNA